MSWVGDKTWARMNHPRPLRRIKRTRLLFPSFKWRRDSPAFWGPFFSSTPCKNEKHPQRSKYGMSAGPRGGDAFMGLSVGLLSHCRLLIQRGVVRAEGSWGLPSQTLIPTGELCRTIHTFWSHKIVPKPNFSHDLAAWPWCPSNVITQYCWNYMLCITKLSRHNDVPVYQITRSQHHSLMSFMRGLLWSSLQPGTRTPRHI